MQCSPHCKKKKQANKKKKGERTTSTVHEYTVQKQQDPDTDTKVGIML